MSNLSIFNVNVTFVIAPIFLPIFFRISFKKYASKYNNFLILISNKQLDR